MWPVTDSADPDRIEIARHLIMKKTALLKIINLWPPYLGAGVRVTKMGQSRAATLYQRNAVTYKRDPYALADVLKERKIQNRPGLSGDSNC